MFAGLSISREVSVLAQLGCAHCGEGAVLD